MICALSNVWGGVTDLAIHVKYPKYNQNMYFFLFLGLNYMEEYFIVLIVY